jgi:hypothetical protein
MVTAAHLLAANVQNCAVWASVFRCPKGASELQLIARLGR